jgi:hypothetical protein
MPDAGPQIDFYTFLVSLGSSALVHLGDAPHPETQQPGALNLPLAHQTIDVLAMLREKTKGNLTKEEEELFDHLLRDLRLRYVERSRGEAK